MYRGDIVCDPCRDRVRKVRRDLLASFANRDIQNVPLGDDLRQQILCCAIQQQPKLGRPTKGLLES